MTDPPKGWYLEYINKKLNMQLLYSLGVSFLDIYPREMKTCVHKQNLYPEVFSSFIHHSHELQATQMSFNKQTVKQAGARACYGTPVRGEEEGTTDTRQPGGTSRGFWRRRTAKPSKLWALWHHLHDKIWNVLRG